MVFAVLVAIDFFIGWLAQNYAVASVFLQIIWSAAVVVTAGGVVWVNRTAYRKVDELEEES